MDALDEQLAQLKLMTSRALSPKTIHQQKTPPPHEPCGGNASVGVAGRNLSPVGDIVLHQRQVSSGGTLTKKIGPAVPPKPLKKTPGDVATSVDEAPRRIQNNYNNMKMTLDNSVILDQQLEALEYHKRQLEKRSTNLAGPSPTPANYRVYTNVEDVPIAGNPSDAVVYSNIRYQSGSVAVCKEPASGPGTDKNQIVYCNVGFGGDFPPPPPLEIAVLDSTAVPHITPISVDTSNFDYLQAGQEDEDLPPPPSPVSSSYSELRRATDNFPQLAQYQSYTAVNSSASNRAGSVQSHQQTQQPLPSHYQQQRPVDMGLHNQAVSTPRSTNHYPIDPQQIYANTQYQNVYSSFEPSSQATGDTNSSEYYGYGDLSQSVSTYESIYEPINPRPPSQLSSRSNYSLYTSYVNGSQIAPTGSLTSDNLASNSSKSSSNGGGGATGTIATKGPNHKEAEVEALTNLLVHSMDSGSDIDSYGICVKCGERVVGESSGCTAMDQIYHINCFTCAVCNVNLQGKPFYAFEGEPYCEVDYLNTLEKCSVCMKPILERILRATGKPYHPGCFCCVVCGNSLDGIPFTVDATNQNYCIEDFHKKFAPRCCVCQQPIMPEPGQEETVRVVALDRSFHFKCYKCEDCGLLLSSEAEGRGCYPLDDHILCKSCNAKRVQALTSRMTTEL